MSEEEIRDLVKECGLDWQRGYMPLFDGDETNRYAILVQAARDAALDEMQAEIDRAQLAARHEADCLEAAKAEMLNLRYALLTAHDHINMTALRVSHVKDADLIEKAVTKTVGSLRAEHWPEECEP